MAIPDNYIDKFTKDGESRMISPAADKVRVDNEHYEGDNLDDVLDEIDEKVSQAGTGNYTKPSTGIPKSDMESAVQTSLGKADSAVQGIQINGGLILPKVHNNVDIFVPSRTSQLQNDSGFITEDDLPEGVECDTQMSSTSVKPVQNKVIKAYVDAVSARIDTLIGSGNVQGAIDTFNEVVAFLNGINSSDTLAAKLALKANASEVAEKLSKSDISVESQGDGTVDINVGSGADKDTYTINLNHTHENMAKLVITDEEPSNPARDTIYALVDNASDPQEIQSLWIAGIMFVGGGASSDEPRLTSPRNGKTIDFEGESTTTLFIKGANLGAALSLTKTGDFTVTSNGSSVSSISASDAENGVTLTLTKGQNFVSGTIQISSSEIDTATVNVIESTPIPITAVKLTGTQWMQTDFVPTANTDISMKLKFTSNPNAGSNSNFLTCYTLKEANQQYALAASWPNGMTNTFRFAPIVSASSASYLDMPIATGTLDNSLLTLLHEGSFSFRPGEDGETKSISLNAVVAQRDPLTVGLYHTSGGIDQIFDKYILTIYEFTVTDNDHRVRHYIPAIKGGVPGMYDTETGHFMSSKTNTELDYIDD